MQHQHQRKAGKHLFEIDAHFGGNIGQIPLDIAISPAVITFQRKFSLFPNIAMDLRKPPARGRLVHGRLDLQQAGLAGRPARGVPGAQQVAVAVEISGRERRHDRQGR